MRFFILILVSLLLVSCARADDPDVQRTGPQLISSKGLPVEEHWVETSDNYVLELIRIPRSGAKVAFLQHGLLDSADTWLVNSREASLAYIMYDAGFDVWLGNSRGNKYSRNNTKLDPNPPFDSAFWDFDFSDMASKDLPTQIDYVLSVTQQEKLVYVGHSQGCAQLLVNSQSDSSWNRADKVSIAILLAPAAYAYNTGSLLLKVIADTDLDKLVAFLGIHEFLPSTDLLKWLLPTVCEATPLLCDSAIYLIAGLDLGDLDQSRMDVYMSHFPSGTSVHNMGLWAQHVRQNEFCMYDYGLIGNEFHYGQSSPPDFNLNNIYSPPLAMIWGGSDDLADPTDVGQAMKQIPSDSIVFTKQIDSYGHLDFVWGEHANVTVYNDVITLAKQYA